MSGAVGKNAGCLQPPVARLAHSFRTRKSERTDAKVEKAFKRSGVRPPVAPPPVSIQLKTGSRRLAAPALLVPFGAKKMGRGLGGPSLGRKRPRRGVPQKYRDAIVKCAVLCCRTASCFH